MKLQQNGNKIKKKKKINQQKQILNEYRKENKWKYIWIYKYKYKKEIKTKHVNLSFFIYRIYKKKNIY